MVATDDGAGGDDKVEDSCNGNEATTAAALVSQMGASDSMQVDGDGNFVLPQVDGPTDILLSEDEENDKVNLNEEPTPENATESAVDESAAIEQDVNAIDGIHAEEATIKEEVTPEIDLPETNIIASTDEVSEEAEDAIDTPVNDEIPMNTNADDAELPVEKEMENLSSPLVDEGKAIKSELPSVQSSAQAPLSEQTSLANITNSEKVDGIEQSENSQAKNVKTEAYLLEDEKSPAPENLPLEDSSISHLSQDESQEAKIKDEVTESEVNLPVESSPLTKPEDEPMITDDSALPQADVNGPPTTASTVTPNMQMKSESSEEPMEQDKFPDLPISPINGVAAPLDKETNENQQKVHIPIKIEIKDDLATSKKENLKQEKIDDARSETGDDSTALSTLATAALGSAEPSVKVKNEQVYRINIFISFII